MLVALLACAGARPALSSTAPACASPAQAQRRISQGSRPNFVLCVADDWSWPHAGVYGDPVVETPAFDRIAREGVLFQHAYAASPTCAPSRAALLTGQWPWRLEGAANLNGVFPDRLVTFPDDLRNAGYATGSTRRDYGPGETQTPGRRLVGPYHPSLRAFLEARPTDRPFFFLLGSMHPHRPYPREGCDCGSRPDAIPLPAFLPDARLVRRDLANYYCAVRRFDAELADVLAALEEHELLERTLVIVTSDNGMAFPRAKSNLYDAGTRVPLAARWGAGVARGRTVEDFVSLTDLAPTFLELAGVAVPAAVTGNSLVPLLESPASGQVDPARDHVLCAKERHVPAQEMPELGGYPTRSIRTRDYLYVRNFEPDRWPLGTPYPERATIPGKWLADAEKSPTKLYLAANRARDEWHYALAFAKRPAEELYDVRADPDEVHDLAADPAFAEVRDALAARLRAELEATGDPRALGQGACFDDYPYAGLRR